MHIYIRYFTGKNIKTEFLRSLNFRDRSLFIAWGRSLDFWEKKRGGSVVTENPKASGDR